MKLKLIGLIIFLGLFPQIVSAQNVKPSPINVGQIMKLRNATNQQVQNTLNTNNEKREVMLQIREERKEQIQAKLTEKRQERIMNLHGRIVKRVESAIERMIKLSDRILARLDVLEAEGESVESLRLEVNSAKDLIENSGEILTGVEGIVDDMLESEDPKAVYPTIKNSVEETKDTLKDAHSILVNVITQIKGLRVGETS